MTSKCKLLKSPYYKHVFNICTEPTSFDPLFIKNINDVADTMVEILIVCGIHRCKAKASKSVLIKAFQFYDIKRHRFDMIEEAGICRSDMFCEFQYKCKMTQLEAILAYNIAKRSVKAFYQGTADYSIRSPITGAVILKEQEFIWKHAATRTIEVFEPYEHLFFHAHQNYAKKIVKVYKELFNRLKSRADALVIEDCLPRGCVKRVIIGTKSPPKLNGEKQMCVEKCGKIYQMNTYIENLPNKEFPLKKVSRKTSVSTLPINTQEKRKKKPKNIDLNLPRCYQCNCPQLICDCNIEKDTGILAIDCSQGPYECQWFRIDEDDEPDPCIEKRELHQCPIDCPTSESSSELDECEYCECSAEDESEDKSKSLEKIEERI